MAKKKEPLAGPDAFWLRTERPTNLMMITGVLVFDEPIALTTVKALLEARFLVFNRFRRRVVNPRTRPYWQDDPDFDLSRHVHLLTLPAPGGQHELEAAVSTLMSTPLDFQRPLWQMHLAENYGSGCALVVRIHHCIGDGMALVHVLLSLVDEYAHAEKKRRGRPAQRSRRRLAGVARAALREGLTLLRSPAHLLKRAREGGRVVAALGKLLFMRADTPTVFKGPLGTAKLAAWSVPLPLADVKALARTSGTKINDVLLTAVCGTLRRYLLRHGAPVDAVNIRTVVPVNLRSQEEAFKLGNRFGLVFLSLPVGIENPHERLAEVQRRMDRAKLAAEAPVVLSLLHVIGSAPRKVQDLIVAFLTTRASAVMTNVPGPRQRLHLDGHPLRQIMFWVPRTGEVSVGISVLSYAGEVLLGVATDAGLVPDPDDLVDGFHRELEVLQGQLALEALDDGGSTPAVSGGPPASHV